MGVANTFFSTIFKITPAKAFLVPFDMNKNNQKTKVKKVNPKKNAEPKTDKSTFGLQQRSKNAILCT